MAIERLIALRDAPLSIDEVVAAVTHPLAGAVVPFLGIVRAENEGRQVKRLEYQAYVPMALGEMRKIAEEICHRDSGLRVAIVHRLGSLAIGDLAVVCAASAPHRQEAFTAARALIDRIKARVPIWKREWDDSGATWIGWVDARCAHPPEHA